MIVFWLKWKNSEMWSITCHILKAYLSEIEFVSYHGKHGRNHKYQIMNLKVKSQISNDKSKSC